MTLLATKECGVSPYFDTTSNTYQLMVNGKTQSLSPGFVDVQGLGNWVLVDEIILNASTVDKTLNGSFDGLYKMTFEGSNSGSNIMVRPNGDATTSRYYRSYLGADTTTVSAAGMTTSLWDGFLLCQSVSGQCLNEVEMSLAKTGRNRIAKCRLHTTGTAHEYLFTSYWTNTTDDVTSLRIVGSGTYSGSIKIYKWQEIKPVELASYELVKEWNLNSQILSESLPWDGETDSDIMIVSNVQMASGNNIQIRPNNDNSASYGYQYVEGYGSATAAGSSGTQTCMFLAFQSTTNSYNIFEANLKKTGRIRQYQMRSIRIISGTRYMDIVGGEWSNTANPVTSLYFDSVTALTGNIKVYKLAKTALISSNPNLLTTYSKSVDNNTIEVQPGEIEINGVICQVTKPTQVTLSGNLQSGLTEAANTVYYLYAVKGTGRSVTYMFSTTAPTMDRYGNIVASFNLCTKDKAWFHPTLGLNYRWIGQVFNNASSAIVAFDKMKPGYFESPWYAIVVGQRTLDHGLGRVPSKHRMQFSTDSAGATSSDYIPYFITSGGPDYGSYLNYAPSTNSNMTIYTDPNTGIFMSSPAIWTTSGYQKHIVESD